MKKKTEKAVEKLEVQKDKCNTCQRAFEPYHNCPDAGDRLDVSKCDRYLRMRDIYLCTHCKNVNTSKCDSCKELKRKTITAHITYEAAIKCFSPTSALCSLCQKEFPIDENVLIVAKANIFYYDKFLDKRVIETGDKDVFPICRRCIDDLAIKALEDKFKGE